MTKPRACDTGGPFRHAARPVPPGYLLNSMLPPMPGHADRQAPLKGYNKVGRSFLERLIAKNGPPDFGQRPISPERGRNAGWNHPVRKSGRISDAQAANVPAAKYGMVKVVFLSCFFIAFKTLPGETESRHRAPSAQCRTKGDKINSVFVFHSR